MVIQTGTKIGSYEIASPLGEGGMGIVFRARDTKLGRSVAIKLLPEALAEDRTRVARFQREAQALAALNHPNIAQIYGLEDFGGTPGIVMELVEGETLADRVKRGPLDVDEAVRTACQIAEALGVAHEKGITHRDLKPANIKIGPDGAVKLLDFGLAKIFEPEQRGDENSRTMVVNDGATDDGMVLGTPAYMAPEQARGKTVDSRADMWAFGSVLYEMLSGKQAFSGETASDQLAAVLSAEPEWKALHGKVPPVVISVLRNCLQKNPNDRFRSAADVRIQLKDATAESPLVTGKARRNLWPWGAAAVLPLALVVALLPGRGGSGPPTPRWLAIPPPPYGFDDHPEPAVSPDGKQVAFVAPNAAGVRVLWIRSFETQTALPLPGTEDASLPFWSPDGNSIGFFAQLSLKTTLVAGGSPQTLAPVPTARGGSWNKEGIILFTSVSGGPVQQISQNGGKVTPVTTLDRAQGDGRNDFPHFLPDGHHFLYTVYGTNLDRTGIYLGDLKGSPSFRLIPGYSSSAYADGFVFFVKDRNLLAQRFDLSTLTLHGAPSRIAEGVGWSGQSLASYSFSSSGNVVAYWAGLRYPKTQLQWFDRAGHPGEKVGGSAVDLSVALSRNGQRIALERMDPGKVKFDLWTVETTSGIPQRVTSEEMWAGTPLLSRDGRKTFFSQLVDPSPFRMAFLGGEPQKIPVESEQASWLSDWSPDERYVLFTRTAQSTSNDIWQLDIKESKISPLVQSTFNENSGRFSPDMTRVAYSSNKTNRQEIYVNSWPVMDNEIPISDGGGTNPQWSQKGGELFYLAEDRKTLFAVDMSGAKPSRPQALFNPARLATDASVGRTRPPYAVDSTGQRFLMLVALDEPVPPSLVVGFDWHGNP